MCYRTGEYTVCRRVRASFSPEILQSGAVNGLRMVRGLVLLKIGREERRFGCQRSSEWIFAVRVKTGWFYSGEDQFDLIHNSSLKYSQREDNYLSACKTFGPEQTCKSFDNMKSVSSPTTSNSRIFEQLFQAFYSVYESALMEPSLAGGVDNQNNGHC